MGRWLLVVLLVGCGGARTEPVVPAAPVTEVVAPEPIAEPIAEPVAEPGPPRERLTPGALETASFVVRPDDFDIAFTCAAGGCLAAWVEGNAILALGYTPGTPLAAAPTRVLHVAGRDRPEVRALRAHPAGFAMLVTLRHTLDAAALELVLLDASGALVQRVPIGPMYANSTDPALAMYGADGLVAYPVTDATIALVSLRGATLGARERSTETQATSPQLGHDGARFVTTWISWERAGAVEHVGPLAGAASELAYLDRPAFACAMGSCWLVGTRDHAMQIATYRGAETHEHVLASPVEDNTLATLLPHPSGALVVLRTSHGATGVVVDVEGARVSDVEIDPTLVLGSLAALDDDHYAEMIASEPSDFHPSSAPCPDMEEATCMDVPDHLTLAFRTLVREGP